jgi:hypothetical protein
MFLTLVATLIIMLSATEGHDVVQAAGCHIACA